MGILWRTKSDIKRNRSTLLCMILCAGMCAVFIAGCGGEYAGLTEGDAVSGAAVSGEAVSGDAIRKETVSGPAVEDREESFQMQTGWMEQETYHMEYMIFSQGKEDSGLRYEKELTECMKSYVKERNGKWSDYDKDYPDQPETTVFVEHMVFSPSVDQENDGQFVEDE